MSVLCTNTQRPELEPEQYYHFIPLLTSVAQWFMCSYSAETETARGSNKRTTANMNIWYEKQTVETMKYSLDRYLTLILLTIQIHSLCHQCI